jgi:acetoin utilization deacetylase AcuC-like enzyme
MTTAVIHSPIFAEHLTSEDHPEKPQRYEVVMDAIKGDQSLQSKVVEVAAPSARRTDVQACHTSSHFKNIERAVSEGWGYLDSDTIISMRSLDAALHAAGGACLAVDMVMRKETASAFVPARPPGHHATRDRAMGFCLLNTASIAARYAQSNYKEIERVAIVDWDVHHGNGTQGIFYDDPSVYFFSMHQFPWYPGTGARTETGTGRGRGYTLNIPVTAKTPAQSYRGMFEAAVSDISSRFTPDLIVISAGFDSHTLDPLGQLLLEDEDFAEMTRVIKQWASESCEGRIVSCLEGGYNLTTLGKTVVSHLHAL